MHDGPVLFKFGLLHD